MKAPLATLQSRRPPICGPASLSTLSALWSLPGPSHHLINAGVGSRAPEPRVPLCLSFYHSANHTSRGAQLAVFTVQCVWTERDSLRVCGRRCAPLLGEPRPPVSSALGPRVSRRRQAARPWSATRRPSPGSRRLLSVGEPRAASSGAGLGRQVCRKVVPIGPGRRAGRTVPAPGRGRTAPHGRPAGVRAPQVLPGRLSARRPPGRTPCPRRPGVPAARSGVFLRRGPLLLPPVLVVPASGRGVRAPEARSVHFRVGERAAAAAARPGPASSCLTRAAAVSAWERPAWRKS